MKNLHFVERGSTETPNVLRGGTRGASGRSASPSSRPRWFARDGSSRHAWNPSMPKNVAAEHLSKTEIFISGLMVVLTARSPGVLSDYGRRVDHRWLYLAGGH